ncbi:bifunctional nicotinamidase/pyrazinamidase [Haliscomenobacter hydrossis]|uniref:Nicotinamidase n=1 Tax=Haliscomenobacter hydrossis (strain ATCC 27775 / DSM 1100 / LMG 10767 / O) TaxID=760192 RepID=F4KVV3_HALH1|nr:bifunctional nicotinamidase/pyrazinamidase [Haliscomenobacter hydrossis]AEE53528.1 Nicotinamidase [Haliscomenobacter hydrossis DSM 1100]
MRTLLLIDLQNDFCPGGALAVEEGNLLIPIANDLMPRFDLVLATQDWHPATHGSFAANHPWRKPGQVIDLHGLSQVLWPIHCVQESFGAEFVPTLNTTGIHQVFVKGTDPEIDSYSGFFDNGHRKATGLGDYLKAQGVDELYVMGIATDYCVKFTVLDALELGFKVNLIQDACRGVNLKAGDVAQALLDMQSKGANLITSNAV